MRKVIEKTRGRSVLVACAVVAIFVATLTPGPIVAMIEARIAMPYLHEVTHVVLFFALGWIFLSVSQRVNGWHALLLALFLALATEGLQHFAVMRHPTWGGVLEDMAGASLAVVLGALRRGCLRD